MLSTNIKILSKLYKYINKGKNNRAGSKLHEDKNARGD